MLLPFEYWPSLTWMKQFMNANEVTLEQWGNYQKQSGANRCKILSDKGPFTLSVPLSGGREQKKLLNEVCIDNSQRWAIQHLRSLRSCYGKAAFFDHYFPLIEKLLAQHFQKLMELDFAILQQLVGWLKLNQHLHLTSVFQNNQVPTLKVTGENTVQPYIQVFSDKRGFTTGLSILDALFCLGPALPNYLIT